MSEDLESIISDRDYQDNIALSYEYIEKSIKEVQDIIDRTNTQLGLLIGFNFTFIRFFIADLPGKIINNSLPCNSCLLFKMLAYGFSFSSITLSLIGLSQYYIELKIVSPHVLIESSTKVSNEELKLAIIDVWETKLKELSKLANSRKQQFNRSIILLLISGSMAIFSKAIASMFY